LRSWLGSEPRETGALRISPGTLKHAPRRTCFSLSSSVLQDDFFTAPDGARELGRAAEDAICNI
jgi:hypothetical protein